MSENLIKTQLRLSAKTDIGKVRDHNEDNYVVCPDVQNKHWFFSEDITESDEGTLLLIADGMGGLNAGEIASAIVIETVQNYFNNPQRKKIATQEQVKETLLQCINDAQSNLQTHAKKHPETKGMGTTIMIAFIKDNVLHTSWVGDSRCYVFRNDIELYFASKDHSYVQELVDSGQITIEQAFYHPESNIITKSLGDNSIKVLKPDFCSFPLEAGDKILLCSDGLNGMLKDDMIAAILHDNQEINEASNALIESANEAGGHDNISLILCDIVNLAKPISDTSIKLYNLDLAVKYVAIDKTRKPFSTLSSKFEEQNLEDVAEESGTSKKNSKKIRYLILVILPLIIIAFFLIFKAKKIDNVKAGGVKTSDSTKVIKSKVNSTQSEGHIKRNDSEQNTAPKIQTSDKEPPNGRTEIDSVLNQITPIDDTKKSDEDKSKKASSSLGHKSVYKTSISSVKNVKTDSTKKATPKAINTKAFLTPITESNDENKEP